MSNEVDVRSYCAVINEEGQYSIWLAGRGIPAGWREVGVTGSKEECLAHIESAWVDMRPISLRNAMADANLSN